MLRQHNQARPGWRHRSFTRSRRLARAIHRPKQACKGNAQTKTGQTAAADVASDTQGCKPLFAFIQCSYNSTTSSPPCDCMRACRLQHARPSLGMHLAKTSKLLKWHASHSITAGIRHRPVVEGSWSKKPPRLSATHQRGCGQPLAVRGSCQGSKQT